MNLKKLSNKKLSRTEMKKVLGGIKQKECPEGEVWCTDPNIKPKCMSIYNCI